MKCPKCGTKNADTNKFCRECGLNLAGVVEQVIEKPAGDSCPPEEAALSAEVLEVMQLYSAGKLDKALVKAENITICNPNSASAHSLVGLIYERKAEQELLMGSAEAGRDFYKLAIEHYEKIISLNPHSAADREKLTSLKRKMAGGKKTSAFVEKLTSVFDYIKSCYRILPTPAKVACGVFFVVLLITLTVMSTGRNKHPEYAKHIKDNTADIPSARVKSSPTKPAEQSFRVYTFPAPATTTQAATPTPMPVPPVPEDTADTKPEAEKPSSSVEPMGLPPLSTITVVPESKNKADADKKTTDANVKNEPQSPDSKIVISKSEQPSTNAQSNGSSTLAEAIRLNDQGNKDEAIRTAQQAITQFQADLDAGRNTSTAARGIENAKMMIKLWQGS